MSQQYQKQKEKWFNAGKSQATKEILGEEIRFCQELWDKAEETLKNKFILDACCGGRQIWFQKEQENTIFMDIREVKEGEIELQPNWCIKPTIIGDYTKMPFKDKSFKLVVWDIPHKIRNYEKSIILKKYGYLGENWKEDTKTGFNEIMRVLDDYGVLEFKFADIDIPIKEILSLFPIKPLFGTITKKGVNNTYWFCFMKIPTGKELI